MNSQNRLRATFICSILMCTAQAAVALTPTISLPTMSPEELITFEEVIAQKIHGIDSSRSTEPGEVNAFESACGRFYQQTLADQEFSIGIALGDWDRKLNGSSPNDRFLTLVNNLSAPCHHGVQFACGFQRSDIRVSRLGSELTVLTRTLTFTPLQGAPVKAIARVTVCNPFLEIRDPAIRLRQQNTCAAFFAQSTKYDDVTIYLGHSRNGGGPDFYPPVTVENPLREDTRYYRAQRDGVKRFLTAEAFRANPGSSFKNPPYKQLYLLACNSYPLFAKGIAKASKAAGYSRNQFAYIGTTLRAYNDGTEVLRILEALGNAQCSDQIRSTYRNKGDDLFDVSIQEAFPITVDHEDLDVSQLFRESP